MIASDRVPTASDVVRTQAVPTASMRPVLRDADVGRSRTRDQDLTESIDRVRRTQPIDEESPQVIRRPVIDDDLPGTIPTPGTSFDDTLLERRHSPADEHHRLWRCPECHAPRTTFGDRVVPPRCLRRGEHESGEPIPMVAVGRLGEREAPTDPDDEESHA